MMKKIDNPKLSESVASPTLLPMLPLRDVVVFPHMVIPLFVGRKMSIKALEEAMNKSRQILLAAQKDAEKDNPGKKDIHMVGTVSTILQLLKLPDGTVKVLVEGEQRAAIKRIENDEGYFSAEIESYTEPDIDKREGEVLSRSLLSQFEQYVKLNKKLPPEILSSLAGIENPARLGDTIAAHVTMKVDAKQQLLEEPNLQKRLELLMGLLEGEIDTFQVEKKIRGRVKKQMEKSQREYYLNEQMKAIQKEIGELDDVPNELEEIEKAIKESGMPKEAMHKAKSELSKLRMMSPMSAEATVSRNFLDWIIKVPWKKRTRIHFDIKTAQDILDKDHYGLDKIKERIIEYLAVQQRVKKLKGPILCFVGPPGVGKTSLGKSIAHATGRKFIRMSLGGVRDEAEIRGHRRTYIGSLPGKILQNMAKTKVTNPLFLLDEVDKMSMDFRGDPASALLEVLDPEQNNTFNDHYLELDYDLSDVMFIVTANSLEIPEPLLDRMEVIRLAGYTEDEKLHIAKEHLLQKQLEANGLKSNELNIHDDAILDIIRYYTREAGVRNLEREISKICRKTVKNLLDTKSSKNNKNDRVKVDKKDKKSAKDARKSAVDTVIVNSKNLEAYLGVRKYRYGLAEEYNEVGQVKGLAWTEVGGELLTIEAAIVPGKGETVYTGHLGEVMQESIKAALTVVRARTRSLGIKNEIFTKNDIHIHVPEGATPKDGPSAGISMCCALASILTEIPVRADVAMTGEITLRGEVLPIGGLKEKLLAALRGGLKTVIIPSENARDLKEIPKNVLENLDIRPVKWIDEVFMVALERMPKPLPDKALSAKEIAAAKAAKRKKTNNKSTTRSSRH